MSKLFTEINDNFFIDLNSLRRLYKIEDDENYILEYDDLKDTRSTVISAKTAEDLKRILRYPLNKEEN